MESTINKTLVRSHYSNERCKNELRNCANLYERFEIFPIVTMSAYPQKLITGENRNQLISDGETVERTRLT